MLLVLSLQKRVVLLSKNPLLLIEFEVFSHIEIVCRQKVVLILWWWTLQIGQDSRITHLLVQHCILILQVPYICSFQFFLVCGVFPITENPMSQSSFAWTSGQAPTCIIFWCQRKWAVLLHLLLLLRFSRTLLPAWIILRGLSIGEFHLPLVG